jgi:EmrB/QacA subfamily drug resistance transporter
MLSNMDMMIVNVAFPAIQHDFRGSTTASLSWTLNAYSIVFAALLVPAGRLADRSSLKNGFLLGVVLFTAASALCGAAQGLLMLVAARVLQAAGAAILVPTALALLLAAYPPERRPSAVRALTGIGSVGLALAPIIGGLLVNVGWRWIFLINLPVGIACYFIGRRVLSDARVDDRGSLPDLSGSILLIISIAGIALGLVKAPEWGWASPRVIGCFVGAVVALVAFALRSARHPNPVISVDLMRIRSFMVANAASLLFTVSFSATLLSITLWSENVWNYSALQTALAIAPGTFLMPLVATSSGKLIKRTGAAFVSALGCALIAGAGIWWAVMARPEPDYVRVLLPGAIMFLVGMILALTTLISVVTKDLPATALATGSAIATTVRQIGLVIGVSMFVAALGTPHTLAQIQTGFQRGWVIAAACALAAAVISMVLLTSQLAPQPIPAAPQAAASRSRRILRLGALFTVILLSAGGGIFYWTVSRKTDVPVTDLMVVSDGQGMHDGGQAAIQIPGTPPQRRHLILILTLTNSASVGDCVNPARLDVTPVMDGQQWPSITGLRSGHETRLDLTGTARHTGVIVTLYVPEPSCTVDLNVNKAILYN